MYKFDAKKVKEEIVLWIRDFFENNGEGCKCVIGLSGGKDSSIVASLCVEALGKDRVVGVLMPQGIQHDIDYSKDLVEFLGIKSYEINIGVTVEYLLHFDIEPVLDKLLTDQTKINLPARIRMCTLYAIAQTINGRVANTCNLSEDYVGYATKFGDGAGDFSPLSDLTVQEVKAIGRVLGLPEKFIEKTPIDGLCGKSDEDNLGFTYAVLDRYLREGVIDDVETQEKIERLHSNNLHKLEPMPKFRFNPDEK
jgi:NAD+ synthase